MSVRCDPETRRIEYDISVLTEIMIISTGGKGLHALDLSNPSCRWYEMITGHAPCPCNVCHDNRVRARRAAWLALTRYEAYIVKVPPRTPDEYHALANLYIKTAVVMDESMTNL